MHLIAFKVPDHHGVHRNLWWSVSVSVGTANDDPIGSWTYRPYGPEAGVGFCIGREPGARSAIGPAAAWWHRFAPAHLTSRILLINLIGLIILVLGILFFNQSRKSLIDARVQSLMTQAQIMAAAVGSAVTTDSDQLILDPEHLIEQQPNPNAAASGNPGADRLPDQS